MDIGNIQAGILQRGAARLDGALHQVFDQGLQLGAGNLDVQVLRTARVGSHVRQVDVGLLGRGQLDLGFLGRFLQTLHGQRVALQVDAAFLLELVDEIVDQADVEVFAAEEGVAVGGQHFELVLAVDFGDLDHRHVEGTAAQVIDDHGVVALGLVQAIGQRRRGRLVDDPLDVEAGDAAGVLGGLALAVVEVGRNGDHRFGDRLAEVVFGGLLHFLQHFGGNLRRRHLLALHFHPGVAVVGLDDAVRHHLDVFLNHVLFEATADQALHRIQGVLRVGDRLALGRLAHQGFAIVGVGDDRGGGTRALGVLDDLDVTVLQDSHAGVGGTQVDANDFAHIHSPETLIPCDPPVGLVLG
ncbi:NAD-specific glutamate dehydrogenase [Klebsiella pneumoniae]|nr:NAD-specific glutamate dehydrogenase [Klebsiella pneumoniae]